MGYEHYERRLNLFQKAGEFTADDAAAAAKAAAVADDAVGFCKTSIREAAAAAKVLTQQTYGKSVTVQNAMIGIIDIDVKAMKTAANPAANDAAKVNLIAADDACKIAHAAAKAAADAASATYKLVAATYNSKSKTVIKSRFAANTADKALKSLAETAKTTSSAYESFTTSGLSFSPPSSSAAATSAVTKTANLLIGGVVAVVGVAAIVAATMG